MKNRFGFWLLMMFLAFIAGRIISPALAAPVIEQEVNQKPKKQITQNLNDFLNTFLQQYWTEKVEKVLREQENSAKKPKDIEI